MALTKDQIELIKRETAPEILGKSQATSAFMSAGTKIPLNGHGTQMVSIGLYDASWVGEAKVKPTVDPKTSVKNMDAHTLVAQFVVSKQTMEDYTELYRAFIDQGGPALATAFDRTVAGYKVANLSNFDTLKNVPTRNVTDYQSLVEAIGLAEETGASATHIVATANFLNKLRALTFPDGRPVFDYNANTILNLPVVTFKPEVGDPTEAFVGNFEGAKWGDVNGIEVAISNEATVGGVSMWETNQYVVRIEARYGIVFNPAEFVRITANRSTETP